VNNWDAIINGGIAGKSQFFGSSAAETVAAASSTGSWNGDYAYSVYSGNPWAYRGGRSYNGANAGSFAFNNATGGVNYSIGHRTILSGY
jgi:hypothetical protein